MIIIKTKRIVSRPPPAADPVIKIRPAAARPPLLVLLLFICLFLSLLSFDILVITLDIHIEITPPICAGRPCTTRSLGESVKRRRLPFACDASRRLVQQWRADSTLVCAPQPCGKSPMKDL